jgi:hypothetical protein
MFFHRLARRAAVPAICLLWSDLACAAPPPGADLDSPLHEWFETQHSVAGAWCCDVADGFILADTDWHQAGDHYEVRIDGQWHPIPPDALRDPHGGPNPTGAAIVWYRESGTDVRIFCFTPGFGY